MNLRFCRIVDEYAIVLACSVMWTVNYEGAQCSHLEREAHPTTGMVHPEDGRTVLLWNIVPKDLHHLLAVSMFSYLISDYVFSCLCLMLLFVWGRYVWHLVVVATSVGTVCSASCPHTQLSCRTKWHQTKYRMSVWCVCVLLLMTVVMLVTDRLMWCICVLYGLAVCVQNSTTEGKHNGGSVI